MRLDDTGRLKTAIWPAANRAALKAGVIGTWHLPILTRHWQIHQAHALMLIKSDIESSAARRVLGALVCEEEANFASLMGLHTPRGLYLATERWLFQEVGEAAGVLHTGRSRNDLNATEQRLALRVAWRRLTGQLLRLAAAFADQAHCYWRVPMPLHTHYQPAVLSTCGHWFAGCAHSVLRLHARALAELPFLNLCPLGAVAIGGTSQPITPDVTSSLLGFDRPFSNSVDAIASRDHLLALFGLAANIAHFVSRVAQDYRFRTAIELGWFVLPEGLAGGSSALPQKKNAWLVELAIARSSRVLGTFLSFFTSSFGEPFTNTIAAGAEALAGASEAVDGLAEAIIVLRLHVRHAVPDEVALNAARVRGFPFAQVYAEKLTREGLTARAAHYEVGRLVRDNIEPFTLTNGSPTPEVEALLDPALLSFGGGPGALSRDKATADLRKTISEQARLRHLAIQRWKSARAQLRTAARRITENSAKTTQ